MTIKGLTALTILNSTSSTTGIGSDLLAAWAASKAKALGPAIDSRIDRNAPTAPWTVGSTFPKDDALVKAALAGAPFFDKKAAQFADAGVESDYARLFASYSGLKTLGAISAELQDDKLSGARRERLEAAFARGLKEVEAFFGKETFEKIRVALGDRVDTVTSKLGLTPSSEDYITGQIHKGSLSETIAGLDRNAQFTIKVKGLSGATHNVAIDLSQMGSMPRSLGGVISFINSKLSAAGVATRIEAVNQAPKTQVLVLGGKIVETRYSGPPIYALKVDVKAGESVSFEAAATKPAFYVTGQTASGGRLIKLEDAFGAGGEPVLLDAPAATADAIGAALGFIGAGEPYQSAPASAYEKRTGVLADDNGVTTGENAFKTAGEAVLSLTLTDGRTVKVTTAWRDEASEAWRIRAGEGTDTGRIGDLAERLTQLLHEQGVAAGVDVWTDDTKAGLSIFTGDGVKASSLTIGDRTIALSDGRAPAGGFEAGLRAGVFARRFETAAVATTSDMFTGSQKFTFQTLNGPESFDINVGTTPMSADDVADILNGKIAERGLRARAAFVESGGSLVLQIDAMHEVTSVSATLKPDGASAATTYAGTLVAPGAWASGGLPNAAAGEPTGDARRTYNAVGGSPLLLPGNDEALEIAITIATATGDKVVNVSISAAERLNDPDQAPGQLSSALQAKIDAALNAAGVYAASDSLNSFVVAEGAGQRLKSVVINGQTIDYDGAAPGAGGGAFGELRSSSSASLAATTTDTLASLTSDPSASITFQTIWGEKTISAALQGGDARDLETMALRLNEALAAEGYDLSVEAASVAGGAGLRFVTGASFSVSNVKTLTVGGAAASVTLDPIDAASHGDDPVGAAGVAARAARGASVLLKTPGTSPYALPNINPSGWFPGRVFDIALAAGAKVLATRASATGADGSVYVIADIGAGDQPVKGTSDVALLKYDSAGKLLYQRTLGASEAASGFALAVAGDGRVAVAGAVEGALVGADKGGKDSFVTTYDADGRELWTARRGAAGDDQVNALAFAADGTLVATGRVQTQMGLAASAGGADGYLRLYSTSGAEILTKQFGTSADDTATALTIRDAGGGAIEITTGGVEGTRGVLRQFTYSTAGGLAVGAVRDIGAFRDGAKIASLAIDNGALYVGGAVGADKLTLSSTAREAVAGLEGFVARVSTNFGSTALDRATYIGSTKDDGVSGVVIADGRVYAAGNSAAAIAGSAQSGKGGFLARLDEEGDVEWLRSFNTSGATFTPTSLSVQTNGASALDRLGLPTGAMKATDSTLLIDRSSLRAGDEFSVGINGRLATRIAIRANDTLSSVLTRVRQAIGAAGEAHIERDSKGVDRLVINAQRGQSVSIAGGPDGKNALAGLGLIEGIVAPKPTPDDPAKKGELRAFGLGLHPDALKVDTAANAKAAGAKISAALSILGQAYTALANPGSLDKTDKEKAREAALKAAPPAEVSAQINAYKLAILRMGGSI
ncbi:MAG: hypothetical protein JNJ73_05740 [Hyphomonadaceae bacterium]|nr:hypothetical protein [Hyphomonadaceae bacterium]